MILILELEGKRRNLIPVIHQSTECRIPYSCSSILGSVVTLDMCVVHNETKEGSCNFAACSFTKFCNDWGRKEIWLQGDAEPTVVFRTHDIASQEGIIGTNVFPRPPCDFFIYCTTKWYFPLWGTRILFLIYVNEMLTHGTSYLGGNFSGTCLIWRDVSIKIEMFEGG